MARITKDHFAFKCPMSWDEMTPSANGRFCTKCSKEVVDLTDCSLEELRVLQRERGSICGMIKFTGAAAVAAASLGSAACQNTSKPAEYLGRPLPPNTFDGSNYDHTVAGVMIAPPDEAKKTEADDE